MTFLQVLFLKVLKHLKICFKFLISAFVKYCRNYLNNSLFKLNKLIFQCMHKNLVIISLNLLTDIYVLCTLKKGFKYLYKNGGIKTFWQYERIANKSWQRSLASPGNVPTFFISNSWNNIKLLKV